MARDKKPTPKAEALRAIDHVVAQLSKPLDDLGLRQLKGAMEYAREQVEAIQEVARVRRTTDSAGVTVTVPSKEDDDAPTDR